MPKPTCTNIPKHSVRGAELYCLQRYTAGKMVCRKKDRGGNSGEVPPLSIPNREVKLTCADGTAPPGGRVGSRRPFIEGEFPETVRMLPLIAYHPLRIRSSRSILILPNPFRSSFRDIVSVPEGCRREALRAVRAHQTLLPDIDMMIIHPNFTKRESADYFPEALRTK